MTTGLVGSEMCIRDSTHTHTHTHTHASNEGIGSAVKNSLEIIIKQVRLEGGVKEEAESERRSVTVETDPLAVVGLKRTVETDPLAVVGLKRTVETEPRAVVGLKRTDETEPLAVVG